LPEIIPDTINNNLQTMMPILDDAMLRIHTVLIISSYAVITLAYAVANCYLVVSAVKQKSGLARGTLGAQAGALVGLVLAMRGGFAHLSAPVTAAICAGLILVGVFAAL